MAAKTDLAISSKVYGPMGFVGGKRTDTITFTATETTIDVMTRLAHIEYATLMGTADDAAGVVWINSDSAAHHQAGEGGQIHATSITDNGLYELKVWGW